MLKVKIHDVNAVVPSKAGPQEVGWDLTAITFVKRLAPNTFMYDTGISVEPPEGYYTEIVPRSSISKTGFILSNSIGIIDPTYRGTLKIVLTKISPINRTILPTRPLTIPFKLCQLLLKPLITADIQVVEELSETLRGEGGFGSTDKK